MSSSPCTRDEFKNFMAALAAAIPRYAPDVKDPLVLNCWYAELGQLDYHGLQDVYRRAVRTCDGFPSIKEVLGWVGAAQPTPLDIGREVAERIWGGISKFGSIHPNDSGRRKFDLAIAPWLGPVGVEVVRLQGGWNRLCDVCLEEDATTWKAQWRGLAETIAKRGPLAVDQGPGFPQLPERIRAPLAELTQRLSIGGKKA